MLKTSQKRFSILQLLAVIVLLVLCGAFAGLLLTYFINTPLSATVASSVEASSMKISGGSSTPSWEDADAVLAELDLEIIGDPSDDSMGTGGIGSDNPSQAVLGQCRVLKAALAGSLCDNAATKKGDHPHPSHYTKDFMFGVVAADRDSGDKSVGGSADGLLKKVVRWGGASHCAVRLPLMRRRVLCMLGVDTHSRLGGVQEARSSWMDAACDHVMVFGKDVLPTPPTPKSKLVHPKGGPNVTTTVSPPPPPPPPTVIPKGACFARAANHGAMRLGQMGSSSSLASSFSHVHRGDAGGSSTPQKGSDDTCTFPDLLEVHSIGEGDGKDTSYPQLMSALGFVASAMHRFTSTTIADFDYVVVVNSGTVVIPENLKALLHDPYVDALHMLDAPLLLGHRMTTKEGVPFVAQAAYILNKRLMASLEASMGDIECFAQHFSGSQDLFFSKCAGGMLGAYPLSTEDAMGQQRIHQLDLDVVNSGGVGIDWYQAYHPGRAALQKGMKGLSRYTSVVSNVPAGRPSLIHRLVVAEESSQLLK